PISIPIMRSTLGEWFHIGRRFPFRALTPPLLRERGVVVSHGSSTPPVRHCPTTTRCHRPLLYSPLKKKGREIVCGGGTWFSFPAI
ncbi:MAG TPA: hypothetical protein VGB89_12005, partial [Bacteroidota bacterium]